VYMSAHMYEREITLNLIGIAPISAACVSKGVWYRDGENSR